MDFTGFHWISLDESCDIHPVEDYKNPVNAGKKWESYGVTVELIKGIIGFLLLESWNHVWNPHLGVQFQFWWIDNVFITTYSISRYVQSTKWMYISLLESVGLRFPEV